MGLSLSVESPIRAVIKDGTGRKVAIAYRLANRRWQVFDMHLLTHLATARKKSKIIEAYRVRLRLGKFDPESRYWAINR